MTKVLISVTSAFHVFYENDEKTGIFLSEALHPYQVYTKAGFEVDFASETGTIGGFDEHSLTETFATKEEVAIMNDSTSGFMTAIKNVKKASAVNPADYAIFFAAGGHGAAFDYPTAKNLVQVAETIYSRNGVVGAVCHGPIIFNTMKDASTGKPIVQGKNVTGFTNVGETVLDLDPVFNKYDLIYLENMFKTLGANYKPPKGPWDDFSVIDGRLVTGVNPASATSTAQKTIDVYEATK